MPIKRSCEIIGISRAAWYKVPKETKGRDEPVIEALNTIIEDHRRWGFWKCFKAIRRKGTGWNHKRIYRVYCLLGLNHKRRGKKRLPQRVQQPLVVPQRPNQVWSADFMSDTLHEGKRFRTFNVIDDFNREALAIEIDTSITGRRLIRVFKRLQDSRGLPKKMRCDNGPEFLSEEFIIWAESNGMKIQYIEPGKPNQNAYIERFNRTYRDELLNLYLFRNLEEVREQTYWWMIGYNEERPHDALGDMTPIEYMKQYAENSILKVST